MSMIFDINSKDCLELSVILLEIVYYYIAIRVREHVRVCYVRQYVRYLYLM